VAGEWWEGSESRRGGGDTSDGGRGMSDNGGREKRHCRVHKHMDNAGRRLT
jgi:hypothetical protein